MKKHSLHIYWILVMIPFMGMTQQDVQQSTITFYSNLAERDARNEQKLVLVNEEDHKDFWKDQKNFEAQLHDKNIKAYFIYLKSKGQAYQVHAIGCDANCNHSEEFYQKAAFYSSYSQFQTEMAFVSKTKKPQIKD